MKKKQTKAIEEYGKHLTKVNVLDKKDDFDTNDNENNNLLFLRQKEKLNELRNKRPKKQNI